MASGACQPLSDRAALPWLPAPLRQRCPFPVSWQDRPLPASRAVDSGCPGTPTPPVMRGPVTNEQRHQAGSCWQLRGNQLAPVLSTQWLSRPAQLFHSPQAPLPTLGPEDGGFRCSSRSLWLGSCQLYRPGSMSPLRHSLLCDLGRVIEPR